MRIYVLYRECDYHEDGCSSNIEGVTTSKDIAELYEKLSSGHCFFNYETLNLNELKIDGFGFRGKEKEILEKIRKMK